MLSKPPSKFSHTLQKFRICKFILIPMSHCHKNVFCFVLKEKFLPIVVCPVRTVCWRFGTYGYQKSGHIGSYGYQKSKIISSKTSKTSKCKSLFELKPNYFEYFNRLSRRKKGMASNSLSIIPDFITFSQ